MSVAKRDPSIFIIKINWWIYFYTVPFAAFPTSAPSRVLAKSSGYTKVSDPAPAKPPDASITPKNFQKS